MILKCFDLFKNKHFLFKSCKNKHKNGKAEKKKKKKETLFNKYQIIVLSLAANYFFKNFDKIIKGALSGLR